MINRSIGPAWVRNPQDKGVRRVIHVSSTAKGGGVAELLSGLIDAQNRNCVPAAWAVITGNREFFTLTKLIHNLLHGRGNPEPLSNPANADLYRSTVEPQASWLSKHLSPEDTVVLHDPQTLGMAAGLASTGARVVWHCHIGSVPGSDSPHDRVWHFLGPHLKFVDTVLTSRDEFAPRFFPADQRFTVYPAIDADAPKNRHLSDSEVRALLSATGLVGAVPVDMSVTVEQEEPLSDSAPVVLQVSRWDPLKGMGDVLASLNSLAPEAHLVLAGPQPQEVPDDPEGIAVLEAVRRQRDALPAPLRSRVHLVTLSMADTAHNALLVNALQRRADVVVQRSLEEGFGLTVTEAMLKGRAVVASDVGGISLQVRHGHNGLLVAPQDHAGFATAVSALVADPDLRHRLGVQGAHSAAKRFLMPRLLADYRRLVHPELVT